ncbi:MAG: hypothetical protein RIQ33_468 [Bacteroidota bacterium]|jgi:hypothetical protein
MNKFTIVCTSLLLFIVFKSKAQSSTIPLGREDYDWMNHIIISNGKIPENFNPTLNSLDRKDVIEYLNTIDSTVYTPNKMYEANIQSLCDDNFEYAEERANNESNYPILKTIYKYRSDLYAYNDHNFVIKLNPVINYQRGSASNNPGKLVLNSRGVEVRGNVTDKIGFYSYFTDNQLNAPNYVKEYIRNHYAVPGLGYYKVFKNDASQQDYLDARGYVTFSAAKYVHFTLGQDRNFIGDGIRSLFLSNNANSTPFFKITTHYKKFDYQNLYLQLTNDWLDKHYDKLLARKFAVMHHLSYNAAENLQFGLFESVILARANKQGFEPAYLNPIIFTRSVEQSLGSPDNASMGMDAKYIFKKRIQFYSQFYLDEFNFTNFKTSRKTWTNKYALQTGMKWIDFVGIKNLDVQAEANFIRPFTYSHHDSLGNYTSYNQNLAHPNGANLKEYVGKIYYQINNRISFTAYGSIINQGLDSLNGNYSWGGNPLVSYNKRISKKSSDPSIKDASYSYDISKGAPVKILVTDITLTYKLMHNWFLDFNFVYRKQQTDYQPYKRDESYFGIGIRINTTRTKYLF